MKRSFGFTFFALLLTSLLVVGSVCAAPLRADRGAWSPNTFYAVNDTVTYGGTTYKCLQAHTSLTGWEPPNVPALWQPLGAPTQGGPSATPTRTSTAAPATNTPTRTPTQPGATNTPSGTCWPAWNASTAYTGGAQVSYNGINYQAAYWTQGQRPDQNSGPAGSGQPWIPQGSCGGGGATATPTSIPPTATRTATTAPSTPTSIPATATRTPTSLPGTATPTTAPSSGVQIGGYFAEWGVYGRNYHVKNIVTSGSAAKLTFINYAFGNVQNGRCVIGDPYAAYDRFYSAADSVDGVADTWDNGALRGNFNQLRKLKQMYPHIKIFYSFGGWTWSGGFAQAAANPTAFAESCYNLLHDPRWDGLFDGIDIDWEYPNACGLTCDNSGFEAFKNLMAALRARFGSELVTAAVPAGYANINAANYGGAAQYVDWYNVMTYDFFGAWDKTTAPHSPLYSYPGIPIAQFYSDYAIQLYKSKGVPASKLLLGVGFYGRGWTGVTQSAPGGSATGPAQGTYEPGIEDYKVLKNTCPPTGTVGGTAYAYCGNNWWSYDTPATLADKMNYLKAQGLRGVFFWELSGDTSNGELIQALHNNR
ncbi:MAG: glycosyl hydrolase family 18 protein [Anaerolineales bacterium]|nr:glycosyl hydrolase family 18 protein [Anaerolineales bacterium]MCX7755314.1 glycosyl hydrolase family 18 protein [Anaerolineales bacterium]MDW8278440.1 glycosyl hydrolase family 18 protein [Anaerolineales bacterium]